MKISIEERVTHSHSIWQKDERVLRFDESLESSHGSLVSGVVDEKQRVARKAANNALEHCVPSGGLSLAIKLIHSVHKADKVLLVHSLLKFRRNRTHKTRRLQPVGIVSSNVNFNRLVLHFFETKQKKKNSKGTLE